MQSRVANLSPNIVSQSRGASQTRVTAVKEDRAPKRARDKFIYLVDAVYACDVLKCRA